MLPEETQNYYGRGHL